jgi:transposase InsO family protein
MSDVGDVQIVGFSDASQSAFGCVVYARVESSLGVHVNMLAAKSRVAPLKAQSLPRLELLGCLTLANMSKLVSSAIASAVRVGCSHFFSDSRTALCWIRNKENRFKQFVEARAAKIRSATDETTWKHVKGELNPADLTTRPLSPSEFVSSKFWYTGPDWLRLPVSEWPVVDVAGRLTEESVVEIKVGEQVSLIAPSEEIVGSGELIEYTRFSCYPKLLRVTALVLRFIYNAKKSSERRCGSVSVEEIDDAEVVLITLVQGDMRKSSSFSLLEKQLCLSLDKKGVLRCSGRMQHSGLSENRKYPIVLPREGEVTRLVVYDAHERVLHGGVNDTMAFVRQRFWVPRLRQLTRSLINRCVICRFVDGRSYSKLPSPPYPSFRINASEPFSNVGVDFAGPLFVMGEGRRTKKAYILLFTCMWTRAIHLELVSDLSASSCVSGLRRLFGRRGVPQTILSDNAKVFRSADVRALSRDRGIVWRFSTPLAPWTGGVWERLVRSVKRCLRKVLGSSCLVFEELATVLVEVEASVNNRPLTYVDVDGVDEAITPNHLIYSRALPVISLRQDEVQPSQLRSSKGMRLHFLHKQKLLRDFHAKWEKEYIDILRTAGNARAPRSAVRRPRVGDVVLVHGDAPRLMWKLGRVMELIPSRDGVVRSAMVKVGKTGNIIKRAVVCLYPLEVSCEESRDDDSSDASVQPVSVDAPESGSQAEQGATERDEQRSSTTEREEERSTTEREEQRSRRARRPAAETSDAIRRILKQV